MGFSKRVRLSLERLEARDVPAHLGQVTLPDVAAPTAQVALTAPHDLGQDVEASIKIDSSDLKVRVHDINLTAIKLTDVLISSVVSGNAEGRESESAQSQGGQTGTPADSGTALKVTFQDINFTQTVSKSTPKLF